MKTSNKFFAELFGTFVLVFGGCGTALFGHVGFLGVAIAFGLTVVAMAYGIGHISGAHLNPAVSFGVFVNGRMSLKEMLVYWAAQFIGGIIAGALLLVIWNAIGGGATGVFASNGFGEAFQKACGGPETGYQAISLGGDADTLGAITGPMAYAYYKEMPTELIDNAKSKLPEWMLEVNEEMDKYCFIVNKI